MEIIDIFPGGQAGLSLISRVIELSKESGAIIRTESRHHHTPMQSLAQISIYIQISMIYIITITGSPLPHHPEENFLVQLSPHLLLAYTRCRVSRYNFPLSAAVRAGEGEGVARRADARQESVCQRMASRNSATGVELKTSLRNV